jgi:hypothetical protein
MRYGILAGAVCMSFTLGLAAQPRVRVEGSVQDPHGAVIMGAQVTAKRVGSGEGGIQNTVSDNNGAFTFVLTQPGTYNLHATADGFVEPSLFDGYRGLVGVTEADGGTEPTVRRVKLLLHRPAVVRGRLVEVENASRRAVAGQTVQMAATRYSEGQISLAPANATAVTDAGGVFVIGNVPPGDYFLHIPPTVSESIMAKPTKKTAKEIDRPRGYRRTYWPDAAESGSAAPIKIDSGADLDLGEIEMKKGPFFRISGTVEFGQCPDGEMFALALVQEYGRSFIGRAGTSLPCRTPFVIHNVSPGSYQLQAWIQGGSLMDRENARMPVVVADEDVQLTLPAGPPHHLQGKIELPESFPPDRRSELKVVIRPVGKMPFLEESIPVLVDQQGSFVVPMSQPGESELALQGLKLPFYVKQVSYNGTRLPGTILALDPYTPKHSIEVTISDRPATVEGSVTVKGDPAPGTRVLVSRWPLVLKGGYPVFVSCRTDGKGHFKQSGLAPGVYRVAAVSDSARWRIERREDAVQVLSAGTEVEISEGATGTLNLEINAW